MPGRPGCGHGDRPVPPGFAGGAAWQPSVVGGVPSAGNGDCSIGGSGHNDGRSRRPGDSRPTGKTVDAVSLHGFASPRFRRAGTTATEHRKRGLIYRGWSVRFFGPVQKARSATDGGGVPIPGPPWRSLCADDGSIPHCGRPSRRAGAPGAPCLCIAPLPRISVTDSVEPGSEPRTTPGAARPAP